MGFYQTVVTRMGKKETKEKVRYSHLSEEESWNSRDIKNTKNRTRDWRDSHQHINAKQLMTEWTRKKKGIRRKGHREFFTWSFFTSRPVRYNEESRQKFNVKRFRVPNESCGIT